MVECRIANNILRVDRSTSRNEIAEDVVVRKTVGITRSWGEPLRACDSNGDVSKLEAALFGSTIISLTFNQL